MGAVDVDRQRGIEDGVFAEGMQYGVVEVFVEFVEQMLGFVQFFFGQECIEHAVMVAHVVAQDGEFGLGILQQQCVVLEIVELALQQQVVFTVGLQAGAFGFLKGYITGDEQKGYEEEKAAAHGIPAMKAVVHGDEGVAESDEERQKCDVIAVGTVVDELPGWHHVQEEVAKQREKQDFTEQVKACLEYDGFGYIAGTQGTGKDVAQRVQAIEVHRLHAEDEDVIDEALADNEIGKKEKGHPAKGVEGFIAQDAETLVMENQQADEYGRNAP